MHIRLLAICALLLVPSACAEQGAGPVLSSGDRYTAATDLAASYTLGVGDQIRVTVYNELALSGTFTVAANGTLALPLIGDVPAGGRTVGDVVADTRTRLADGYLREPKVSAEVISYRPFYILGEVELPGQYPYAVGLTALNAVATAKGFTPRANRDVVQIRRQGENAETNYRLTPQLQIYPGDTIRVGERFF